MNSFRPHPRASQWYRRLLRLVRKAPGSWASTLRAPSVGRRSVARSFPRPDRLVLHGTHHKVATVWTRRVLRGICDEFGWRFYEGRQEDLPEDADVFFQDHSRFDLARLPAFVGSHVIRDPRDVVVSGYFYHRSCNEAWCRRKRDSFGGRSYQEMLLGLDEEDGLEFEMRHVGLSTYREMMRWTYDDPRFIEVRYEDLVTNEAETFERIFRHFGLRGEGLERSIEISGRYSFERVTRRRLGEAREGSHLRSGKPGQWRSHFTPRLVETCKELYGEGLIRLGYESGEEWGL